LRQFSTQALRRKNETPEQMVIRNDADSFETAAAQSQSIPERTAAPEEATQSHKPNPF